MREGRCEIPLTSGNCRQRMKRFGLAFTVTLSLQQNRGAAEHGMRLVVFAAQSRHFRTMSEGAGVAFHRLDRESVDRSGQAAERARRDPLLPLIGYQLGRASELIRLQKVAHGLLPIPAAQKVVGYLRMFGQHPGPSDLRKQSAPQKIPEEGV